MMKFVLTRLREAIGRPLPEQMTCRWRGVDIAFDPRSDIGFHLRRQGRFEEREIDLATAFYLAGHAGTGRCILDVGANVGIHSLLWARAIPDAPIFAIEPAPRTHVRLRQNIDRNDLAKRIRPLQCAIADGEGDVEFFVAQDDAYSALKDTRRKPIREVIRVPARTLDCLVKDLGDPRLGLVKVDVEGAEASVFAGGRKVLTRDRPVLMVEIYAGVNSNGDPSGTIASILNLGYRAFVFREDLGLTGYTEHDDRHYNYFFLPLP